MPRAPKISIYKRAPKSYSLRWRENGKQREQRGYKSYTDADYARSVLQIQLSQGLSRHTNYTLSEVVVLWYENHVPLLAASSQQSAKHTIRILSTFDLWEMPIRSITNQKIQTWAYTIFDSPSVLNRHLDNLSSIFTYAMLQNVIETNPVRLVKRPAKQRKQIIIPSVDVYNAFAKSAPSVRDRLMLQAAAFGGLRQGELLALEAKHLKDNALIVEQVIDVQQNLKRTTKTNHSRRVPIPDWLFDGLQEYAGEGFLFTTSQGKIIHAGNYRKRVWKKWQQTAYEHSGNVECLSTLWRLWRHYAISRWVSVGATPLQCSRWAGHGSFSMTMDRYGFLFDDDEVEIMRRLNQP